MMIVMTIITNDHILMIITIIVILTIPTTIISI